MKITVKDILKHKPCSEYTKERLHELLGNGKTLKGIASLKIPISHRIWAITRFLPDTENRKFAIWCAKRCKTEVKEIKDYIKAIEDFYINKIITESEFDEARRAANRKADWAANGAANWTADWAANGAANSVAERAADWTANRAANRAANWTANVVAERKAQIKKLKQIVKKL